MFYESQRFTAKIHRKMGHGKLTMNSCNIDGKYVQITRKKTIWLVMVIGELLYNKL